MTKPSTSLERRFGESSPLKASGWKIIGATIRIVLSARYDQRRKTLTVTLRTPNSTTLPNKTEKDRNFVFDLLARWNLIAPALKDIEFVEVIFEGGRYGFFCPQIGFVPVERSELFRVKPDLQYLIQNLADTFNCKRRKTTPVHGQTWRVGAVETPGGDASLYLHPRLRSAVDLQDLETAMRREVRSPFRPILIAQGALMVP